MARKNLEFMDNLKYTSRRMMNLKDDVVHNEISDRDTLLRSRLINEYQKRAQANPAFSLRAFAEKLQIDQSLLSKILSGKRKFSSPLAAKAAEFLGIYVPAESKPLSPVNSLKLNLSDYNFVEENQFLILSDWYHFAILELIKTKDFKFNLDFVSERLGITRIQARMALERLESLNFIKIEGKSIQLQRPSNEWFNSKSTNIARKKLQKSLLEKAQQTVEDTPFELRDNSSNTMAIDPKHLPEVREKIKEFRRSLDKFLEKKGNQSEVYNLSVAFFPLTKPRKKS